MKKIKKIKIPARFFLLVLLCSLILLPALYNNIIPDSISCISGESLPRFGCAFPSVSESLPVLSYGNSSGTSYTATYKLFGLIPVKSVAVDVKSAQMLYVGGMPFGVRFSTDGLVIVGLSTDIPKSSNPAYNAGLRTSDIITAVNGKSVSGSQALTKAIEESNGSEITLSYLRNGKKSSVSFKPYYSQSEQKYKAGILVRDSGGGIGTVTYIVPSTNEFGGLGHGICDSDTGALLPLTRGGVTDVTVNSVVKGVAGTPGELHGSFGSIKTGTLLKNTSCGVFGMFVQKPSSCGDLLPVGSASELKCGEAFIYCTLDNSGVQKYSIKITNIDRDVKGNKCFSIKITDPRLISKTGGIVQGMSGSPIIQNGKLVGAVTHVMVNDPTAGYGIFIENMLGQMDDLAS